MSALWPPRFTNIPLRIVVVLTCVAAIAACAGAITLATYNANSTLVLRIARDSFERTGIETINNTEYLLQPVAAAIDAMAALMEDDATSSDKLDLQRFLFGTVDLYPQVYSAYVGSRSDGRFLQVQRIDPEARTWGPKQSLLPPGSHFALRTVDGQGAERTDTYRYLGAWNRITGEEAVAGATYDPRGRPFYTAALDHPGRVLTDIYTFASNGKPGITIARKIVRDGQPTAVVAADITLERLSQFLAAQPVGQHGLALIVDAQGKIVATPRSNGSTAGALATTIDGLHQAALSEAWSHYHATMAPTFVFPGPDGDYLAAFRQFPASFDKDWIIMEVAPVDDFVGPLKTTSRQITFFSLGVAVLGGLFSLLIAGQVTKPIGNLIAEADRIRSLDLEGSIRSGSRIREIQHLIDSMSAMKTALRTLAGEDTDDASVAQLLQEADQHSPHANLFRKVVEKVERRRARETELSLASAIQHSVLPRPDPATGQPIEIAARMRAAKEIGGDFYDWVWPDDGRRLVFVIADVSGKGIPAALFMASTRTAIRTMIMAGRSIGETVEGTNRLLAENNDRCFFVTLFIGELDIESGRLTYINAGHEPVRVLGPHADALMPCGPALGIVEDADFEAASVMLRPGDTLLALTDGVTDAVGLNSEQFGEERLNRAAVVEPADPAERVVERIFDAVDTFAGDELQFDDITCVVLRYRTGESVAREAA